ncbi:MAG: papain-like cysteine protease family protein [Chthoniobacter sp.]|uniref:papain-like cysteine protease family protein n=1 Tax=Chthoniobacter sp. TaxID=2510640 RepID=UPI0032A5FDB2
MKSLLCTLMIFGFVAGVCRADMDQISPGYFVAGVRSVEFEFSAAPEMGGRQRQANWCWAACVQMVLNYHGLRVRQEDVVQRIFGGQVDAPGQPQQILAALSGWAPDVRGRYSAIQASPYVLQGSDIVRDLAYKWPLIVGLRNADGGGHALVLTAVYYHVAPNNQPIFEKVILRDPWPSNPSRQELSWQEFVQRVGFMARVSVQRQ